MADIVVTASSVAVQYSRESQIRNRFAAAAILAGQPVYYDANGKMNLCQANSTVPGATQMDGVCLDPVAAGECARCLEEGWAAGYTLSGVPLNGDVFLSDTPGTFATSASLDGSTGAAVARCDYDNSASGVFNKFLRINRHPRLAGAREVKILRLALAGAALKAATMSIVNPETTALNITRTWVSVATPSSIAATIDVGTTIASAVTISDNLIDGASVAVSGAFDYTFTDGANAKSLGRLPVGGWVTINNITGDATGLVGFLNIEYIAE